MKVWNFGLHNSDLKSKVIYTGDVFVTKLLDFFSNKFFGNSVNEIFYYEFCMKESLKHPNDNMIFYIPKSKKIEITVVLDLETALKANNKEYSRYLANCYLDRTQELMPMKINNFNADEYLKELESFFVANKIL